MAISAAYPFTSHYADVEGVRLHYIEQGTGDPILFLHGNPTWSYLWRNVLPPVSAKGRCIAMDLVGFGKSEKPDIEYSFFDHCQYVEGFIRALGLTNVTLVLHDWGGAIGADYALRHCDNVKAIVFLEALVFTLSWNDLPENIRDTFKAFRTPEVGWKMICEENMFIEQIVPAITTRPLSSEEHDWYRLPFPTVASRKPVWKFPNILPFDDRQDETYQAVKNIEEGLSTLTMPMLLLQVHPGVAINEERARWFRERLPALKVGDLGPGLHYVQEDCPEKIGHAITQWLGEAK